MSRNRCGGFHVYHESYFYALGFLMFRDLFSHDPLRFQLVFDLIFNSTLAHMSNNMSKGYKVTRGSAYSELASKFCPKVYLMCNGTF